MKKIAKKSLIGLLSIPLLLGTVFTVTACKPEVKSIKEVCDVATSMIENVETSTEFKNSSTTVFYKQNSTTGMYEATYIDSYIPNYSKNDDTLFDIKVTLDLAAQKMDSNYVRTRLIYDTTWAYSYNVIKDNINVLSSIGDVKLNSSTQKAAENLKSYIDSFNYKSNQQKLNRNEFVDYIYDLNTQGWNDKLAENALYNYLKDYKNFVKDTLELAKVSTSVVDTFMGNDKAVEYKPETPVEEETEVVKKRYSNKFALQTFDIYYKFLAESTGFSKNNTTSDFGNMCKQVYNEYLQFCGKMFDGLQNKTNYTETLTEVNIVKLEKEKLVIDTEEGNINDLFGSVSISYLNTYKNGDEVNFTAKEKTDVNYLSVYYLEIIKDWWTEFTSKIFNV